MNMEKKELNVQMGRRLQEARENVGYTQERFAEVLGVSVEHYRKLEGGVYSLQPEKMLLLYEEFKIDPTHLITGELDQSFQVERYLANCTKEERNLFLERMSVYLRGLLLGH